MTVGIAALGPQAGAAVLESLRAVETVSRGEIGGFVTLAAIANAGDALCFTVPRGGADRLFGGASQEPPPELLNARIAGVISSGPDRPEPLERFIALDATAGLVTGHRSPDARGRSGIPLNQEVLALLRAGSPAKEAVDTVIAANEQADVGLIAVDLGGGMYARNSARVAARPDVGAIVRHDSHTGARVAVLHNAIQPAPALAALAAELALGTMCSWWAPELWLTVRAGTPVEVGPVEAVEIDDDDVAVAIRTADASLLAPGGAGGACPYLGATVYRSGRALGTTVSEGYTVVANGRIESIVGRSEYRLGCRLAPRRGAGS